MFKNANEYKFKKSDSEMIQAAIDDAQKTGEAVVIPKINERTGKDIWDIDAALLLHSGSVIILQNAHLRLSDGAICNIFSNSNARNGGERQHGIHIKGIGLSILDGGEHNGLYEDNGITRKVMKKTGHHLTENCSLFFKNTENIVVENITIKNQRYWGMCFFASSHGRVSNIRLESSGNVPNQDGIDLGTGCHDFIVENITGSVGDNGVALLATDDDIYCSNYRNKRDGDIHNIIIRNLMFYGVGGCSLVRLLNHDGYRIYNVKIDNIIEASPWSEADAALAQNPDLCVKTDDEGNILPFRRITVGEIGYRTEAAIIIGESYWYKNSKAQHGDTFGISVSNVMTHARFAVFLNNTLLDSSFENIRVFGNGYMGAYLGEGCFENLRFCGVTFDKDSHPHKDDEHINVEWNKTRSDGFSAFYFNNSKLENVSFKNVYLGGKGRKTVFGGNSTGSVKVKDFDNCGIAWGNGAIIEN